MANDLSMLSETVRGAVEQLDMRGGCTVAGRHAYEIIRAELLRLHAEVRAAIRDEINTARDARTVKDFASAKQRECLEQRCRAERAEAKLAALTRKIVNSSRIPGGLLFEANDD